MNANTHRKTQKKHPHHVAYAAVLGVLALTSNSALAQNKAPVDVFSSIRTNFDLFVGQDKPGPYTLSWTQLRVTREDKVLVVVDGTTLNADQYTLDAVKGIITFKTPLKKTSVARVNYSYDSRVSQRNANVATTPVTVPLMRFGANDVKLTAVPTGENKTGSEQTPLVWSMGGKTRFLNGGLTSQFNYAGSGGTGMRFGYGLGNDRNGVDATFLRSEKSFATKVGKNFDMAEAAQKWSIAARLRPMNWLGANFSTNEGDDLSGKGNDTGSTTYGLMLGGNKNQPTLNFNRVENVTVPQAGAGTTVTTDKIDLTTGLGPAASLVAKATRVDTAAADSKNDTQTEEAYIALTAASKNKSQQAQFSLTTNSKDTTGSTEDKQALSIKLQPGRSLTLAAEKKDQVVTPLNADGTEGKPQTAVVQTATAELLPLPGTKLTGSVQANSQNDAKTASTDLSAEVKMARGMLEVAGGVTNRSTDGELANTTSLNSTRARIAVTPFKGITFTGSYIENPEASGRIMDAMRHELGFNAKFGRLDFGSGYAMTTLNGLEGEDGGSDPQYGEISISLGMQFSRFTRLSGNYKDGLLYGSASSLAPNIALRTSRLYGLNLTHDLGSAFSFTFGGQLLKDRINANAPQDVKAEAKIGAKF
jgi:hypothetical protein